MESIRLSPAEDAPIPRDTGSPSRTTNVEPAPSECVECGRLKAINADLLKALEDLYHATKEDAGYLAHDGTPCNELWAAREAIAGAKGGATAPR